MMWQDQDLTCTACNLQLYSSDKSCQTCDKVFCASCYSLKAKLDSSSSSSSSSGKSGGTATSPCQSCQNLIQLKKQSKPILTEEEDANRANAKPSEDSYGSNKPLTSNSNTNWQNTKKNDLSPASRHHIVPIKSQTAKNNDLSAVGRHHIVPNQSQSERNNTVSSASRHHLVPIQSQTARNSALSAASKGGHNIVPLQSQTARNNAISAASKGGHNIVPIQSQTAMTNDFDAVDEGDWDDMEDEDTLVTNNDPADIFENTPYALVLCGLVNPEELKIQMLQKQITTLKKQMKKKETIETQSKSQMADAHQVKSGKNSGAQNMGRHLFSEFSKSNKREQSDFKSNLKDSNNFPGKGSNTKASGRNHNETFDSSTVHDAAMQESWNTARAGSEGNSMPTKMNATMGATNKENLEASFRSNIHDGTSIANGNIDSSDYAQANEYQAQVPYDAFGNSSSDPTSNWLLGGKPVYPSETYSASISNREDQLIPRASDKKSPQASDKQTYGVSDQHNPGASEFSVQFSVSSNSTSSVKQELSLQLTTSVPKSLQQVSPSNTIRDSTNDTSESVKEQGKVPWNISGCLGNFVEESKTKAESVSNTNRKLFATKSDTERLRKVRLPDDNRYSDLKDLSVKVTEINNPNFLAEDDVKTSRKFKSANKYLYTESAVGKTKTLALGTQTVNTESTVQRTKPIVPGTQTVKTESTFKKTKPIHAGTLTLKTEASRSDKRNVESPSSIRSSVNSKKNISNRTERPLKEVLPKGKPKQTKKSKNASAFCNQDAMEKYDFDEDEELDELHDKPYALSIAKGQLSDESEAALSLLSLLSPSASGGSADPGGFLPVLFLNLPSSSPYRRGYKSKNANRVKEIPYSDKKDEKVTAKPDDEKATGSFKLTLKNTRSPDKNSSKKSGPSTSVNKNSSKNIQTENKTTHTDTASALVAAKDVRTSEENAKKNQKPGAKSSTVHTNTPKDSKPKPSVEKKRPAPTKPAPVLKLHNAKRGSSLEDKYYMGFLRLKERQTNGGQKCSSCGRPECQGENMLSMRRLVKSARENGFQLQDVSPDGNCMFAAIVDQLAMYGDHRFTTQSLRQAAVDWLENNPYADGDTPRSAFLSEDWWQYIDRMRKDGQWGDHVILEAIVEVIGCTVKVMSPGEKEIHWTQLEPRGEGALLDDRHLVLGHVGEFHYTSLRPTEIHVATPRADVGVGADSFLAVDVDQEETEEDELVAMFREDYIDKTSDLPVAHLSYLLKTIIPVSLLDEAAIFMSEHSMEDSEEYVPPGRSYTCQTKLLGPVSEGVHVRVLDEYVAPDSTMVLFITTTLVVRKDKKIVSKDGPNTDLEEYVLDESSASPGYTRLFRKSDGALLYGPGKSELSIDRMKKDCLSKYPNCKLYTIAPQILAFECHVWPEAASAWKTRRRNESWPSEGFIQSIIAEGCLVIPSSRDETGTEWEFCFGLIEKRIFREIVSQNQKHGYIMFKTLCRQSLQEFDKVSQVIKSIFFYACEIVPIDLWENNTGACVMHMLENFHQGMLTNNLPHYFIPSQNMLAEIAETDVERMREEVNMLRMQPLLFLMQIQELALVQYKGNEIIDLVAGDIPNFIQHRSVRQSIMDAFLPSTILIAKENIRLWEYKKGYEILSKAYEERLAISTCDDSIAYQMFLTGALGGLDLKSTTWFSAYADKILQGQLSRSLIQEVCSDLPLAKIGQLLPADVAGEYCDIEVPMELFQNFGKFCLDFAKFLYRIEKMPAVLPVMYHCFERYKQERIDRESSDQGNTENKNSVVPDVEDSVMLELFVGMAWVYQRQGQLEFFRGMIPDIKLVCERIDTRDAYQVLFYFCSLLNDKEALQSVLQNYGDKFSFRDAASPGRYLKCMSDWSQGTMLANSYV